MADPASNLPVAKIELSFECNNLANTDVLSKSDPQIYLFMQPRGTNTYELIGKTEVIKDNLNPRFATGCLVDYFFEETQKIKIVVLDIDDKGSRYEDHDFIGEVYLTIGEVVGARGALSKRLQNAKINNPGIVNIRATEVKDTRSIVYMQLAGSHLDKKDTFGKSDPYLTISRQNKDGTWQVVHRTEVLKNTLNPTWNPFNIPMAKLNGGDMHSPVLFTCFDWDKVGQHDLIGEFQCTVQQLLSPGIEFHLINAKYAQKKKHYTDSGVIRVLSSRLEVLPTFMDYIAGGTEIGLLVAVDFTASNGDPKQRTSLHYLTPTEPNEYAKAIIAVGEILAPYDSDNTYPIYGFGAKVPPAMKTSHMFPLTFDDARPEVFGVKGMLDSYYAALQQVQLYGPTNFAPTIKAAAARAGEMFQSRNDVQSYLILLILTDGEITDMDETVDAIVNASTLPMSIVIVGVGNEGFVNMQVLDGDDGKLRSRGRAAARDIVQFVPFREFRHNPARLAAVTLAEIPEQFLSFMAANNIKPRPPPSAEDLARMRERQLAAAPPPAHMFAPGYVAPAPAAVPPM